MSQLFDIEKIIALRRELHQNPEISNHEVQTSQKIEQFVASTMPSQTIPLASNGKAFVFDSGKPGPTIMFRAELDALPIQEVSNRPHRSQRKGVSHACGHDGHMAILAGLGQKIAAAPPAFGRAILLFQPAEEVEQGARDVVNDPAFQAHQPDYIFGLHNIPGQPTNTLILNRETFAAASQAMIIKLQGRTAHSAEPENGISPAMALASLIRNLNKLNQSKSLFSDFTLLTLGHVQLGEPTFGTSPGNAVIYLTLRAFRDEDMHKLQSSIEKLITNTARRHRLFFKIEFTEVFPALLNQYEAVQIAEQAATELKLPILYRNEPFKWSEDFSYFSQKYPACFFGLGAGIDQPPLHHPNYDFPDKILETGINLFFTIYKKLLNPS